MMDRQSPKSDYKIRLVILEDERFTRMGMELDIKAEDDIELVLSTDQPGALLAAVKEQKLDIAAIDLRIGDDEEAGLRVIREIRACAPAVKIIIYTALPGLPNFLAGRHSGVEAFVKKSVRGPRPTLPELARHLMAGGEYYDPDVAKEMSNWMNGRLRIGEIDAPPSTRNQRKLTEREGEVLQLLSTGISKRDIAKALVISPNTLKTHMRNIMDKLGAPDAQSIVWAAIEQGILGAPPATEE